MQLDNRYSNSVLFDILGEASADKFMLTVVTKQNHQSQPQASFQLLTSDPKLPVKQENKNLTHLNSPLSCQMLTRAHLINLQSIFPSSMCTQQEREPSRSSSAFKRKR